MGRTGEGRGNIIWGRKHQVIHEERVQWLLTRDRRLLGVELDLDHGAQVNLGARSDPLIELTQRDIDRGPRAGVTGRDIDHDTLLLARAYQNQLKRSGELRPDIKVDRVLGREILGPTQINTLVVQVIDPEDRAVVRVGRQGAPLAPTGVHINPARGTVSEDLNVPGIDREAGAAGRLCPGRLRDDRRGREVDIIDVVAARTCRRR